ncbi:hypothetical protein BD289DRAFT_276420 [Coniella lustricola]|uniref:Proteophosphoglycan ppg4 n=1 Tax=Coniella lustricola TaxID=2025994 RepID=A0A2T3A6L7_9PEZI|nr:hypothetical protein BD289DRAFT_276420 [Coniella lustricola]
MGNTPSKHAQGQHLSHKLSKKPGRPTAAAAATTTTTITTTTPTTTAGLLPSTSKAQQQGGIIPTSNPTADFFSIPYSSTTNYQPVDDDDQDETTRESSHKSVQRRLSVFRSRSYLEAPAHQKSRRNTMMDYPAQQSGAEAISRAYSLSTRDCASDPRYSAFLGDNLSAAPRDRTSWAYDMSSYEAQRILNLPREESPNLPPNPISTFQSEQALSDLQSPRRYMSPASQTESSPVTRSNSEISLHPPMRRRSLIQTPGVATRPAASANATWSRRSSFRYSHPPTPSMSRQPSVETLDNRLSMPPLPKALPLRVTADMPRAPTPESIDYTTTGAFRLGTLRITNGSPDLTPNPGVTMSELGVKRTRPSAISGEDYFANSTFYNESPSTEVAQDFAQLATVVEGGHEKKRATSPVLEVQSKHAAIEDDLFEDDAQFDYSGIEVLDVRIDPNARRILPRSMDPSSLAQGVTRSDSGFESNTNSDSSRSCNSLTKADSGYSSNKSLRSFRDETFIESPEKKASISSVQENVPPVPKSPLKLQSTDLILALESSANNDRGPTPPPKDVISVKHEPRSPVQAAPRSTVRKQLEVIDTSESVLNRNLGSLRSITTSPATPTSVESDDSISSSLSIGHSTQRPGRLQRLLSLKQSTKPPLTVHETHALDNIVPSIPKDVEDKLREHTGMYPMTARRLTLQSHVSKETLKTILSVGSLEVPGVDGLPPRTPTFPNQAEFTADVVCNSQDLETETTLKQTLTSMQSSFKTVAASMRQSRKAALRKPVPTALNLRNESTKQNSLDETMLAAVQAELSSHSRYTNNLGGNAYDVAAKALYPATEMPSRSQSMTATQRQQQSQLRTFSLSTKSSRDFNQASTSYQLTPAPNSSSNDRDASSQASLTPLTPFRSPPPRSPVSPQGPAAMQRRSHLGAVNQSSPTPPPSYMNRLNLQRGRSAAFSQSHVVAVSSQVPTGRASLDLYRPGSAHSALRHQSSLDGTGKNQLRVVNISQATQQGPSAGREFHAQMSSSIDSRLQHGQLERVPPYVPRKSHRRNQSAGNRQYGGEQAPYRILHSYNSPAYRNAPIWG